uniref:Uncharacterized protein n=1 Tax=Zea mays TaxID=4577 RepID=B8A3J4_MAIZE|nr:unknown [Zea mays]
MDHWRGQPVMSIACPHPARPSCHRPQMHPAPCPFAHWRPGTHLLHYPAHQLHAYTSPALLLLWCLRIMRCLGFRLWRQSLRLQSYLWFCHDRFAEPRHRRRRPSAPSRP